MRVKMLTTAQGPGVRFMAGHECEVDDETLAAALVAGGYAIEVVHAASEPAPVDAEPPGPPSEAPEPKRRR